MRRKTGDDHRMHSFPEVAFTIARMPSLIASGNSGHAFPVAAGSGSPSRRLAAT